MDNDTEDGIRGLGNVKLKQTSVASSYIRFCLNVSSRNSCNVGFVFALDQIPVWGPRVGSSIDSSTERCWRMQFYMQDFINESVHERAGI